jgi:hypothetical protein
LDILLNAPAEHVFTHFKHPVHAPELTVSACLCQRKDTFPITFEGQASRHAQQALHLRGFNHTYGVRIRSIDLLCFIAQNLFTETSKNCFFRRSLI